ncbi:MAG: nucleoside-diphosphate kinase [Leadbetterella sp.]
MRTDRTFSMIKPHAVADQNIGGILKEIEKGGFRIVALKKLQMSASQAGSFYAVHKERPFYGELCELMSSGPIVALILEKSNAVQDYRALIGSTDPLEANEGTIRKQFAKSKSENAVHGSDSDENAAIESSFFFSETERY